jgi:hypothetical protein
MIYHKDLDIDTIDRPPIAPEQANSMLFGLRQLGVLPVRILAQQLYLFSYLYSYE